MKEIVDEFRKLFLLDNQYLLKYFAYKYYLKSDKSIFVIQVLIIYINRMHELIGLIC
jgi:hypothetical protein